MEIRLNGIIIIVGNYGSGKTEVSINLAVNHKQNSIDVCVVDLDLINPYFRTREVKAFLLKLGIDLILPPEDYLQADLPILSPAVAGMIRKQEGLVLFDMGGGVGATVLAALADSLKDKNIQMLQVVNPYRPFTETIEDCMRVRDEIEAISGLSINGLIGNANLMDETVADHIYRGYDFVARLSKASGLPLIFITAAVELLPELDINFFSCPVLPIEKQLGMPWEKAVKIGE